MKILSKRGAMQIRSLKDTEIFANSALSEYLAAGMLGGTECIDLSSFPEAKNVDLVEDALLEAYYQNPLILGVQGYRVDRSGTKVWIEYDNTARMQAKQQEELKEKIFQVISKIVKSHMTDEEKELAINQYLCDTIVYDDDALLNAQENDFRDIDEKYYDSFTAYGALINGKCVCSGYAAAFKLLADAADLESIVVTGFLDGGLSHAWNKVKSDNDWQIVDVTNNDNEELINALLNHPSSVGDRVLAEDLLSDGKAVLRTDYALNDEQFYQIAGSVYDILGEDINLYGYYWIGVIYLTTEETG